MNRALLLPEIVTNILETGKYYPNLLFTGLFINKLFFLEASRILWYGCGSRWDSGAAGYQTPDIRNLAEIVRRDAQRAQIYANVIHVLYFSSGGGRRSSEETQYHSDLTKLQWPQLEELGLHISYEAVRRNKGDVILQYAQSNLKHLQLDEGSHLDDGFLDALLTRCPKLRVLALTCLADFNITSEGLLRFLNRARSLTSLTLRAQFKRLWAQDAFAVISTYQNLDFLIIPSIEENWIDAVSRFATSSVFPKMRWLYTSISDSGLEQLSRIMPNLETLELYNSQIQPSRYALASAAKFTSLKALRVQLGEGSCISGAQLVQLARACPNLGELSIAEDQEEEKSFAEIVESRALPIIPSAEGITDEVIDEFARTLPKLKNLHLYFHAADLPSLDSLLSLGRHCPELSSLALSCNVKWTSFMELPYDVIFPELWKLQIFPNGNRLELPIAGWATAEALGDKIKDAIPEISCFLIEEPTRNEERLMTRMTSMIYGSESYSEEDGIDMSEGENSEEELSEEDANEELVDQLTD